MAAATCCALKNAGSPLVSPPVCSHFGVDALDIQHREERLLRVEPSGCDGLQSAWA